MSRPIYETNTVTSFEYGDRRKLPVTSDKLLMA